MFVIKHNFSLLSLIFTAVIFCSHLLICCEKYWGGKTTWSTRHDSAVKVFPRVLTGGHNVSGCRSVRPSCVSARETTHTDATHVDDRKSMNPSRVWRKHSAVSAHSQNLLVTIWSDSFTISQLHCLTCIYGFNKSRHPLQNYYLTPSFGTKYTAVCIIHKINVAVL